MKPIRVIDAILRVWLIVVSVLGLPFMAFVGALMVDLIRPLTVHAAVTYYIAPAGVDTLAGGGGTTTSNPWKTWSFAFANSVCGDTLTVIDGTFTPSVNGNPVLTKGCTVNTVYTVQFQNQRVALIAGTGSTDSFAVVDSTYIVLDGFRGKSADLNSGGGSQALAIRGTAQSPNTSHHITVKNSLFYDNNRYKNSWLLLFTNTNNSLVEDTEFYSYHRHAMQWTRSDFNVARRVYCHSRNRADIAGGFASALTDRGEGCVAIYPANDNILENVIVENSLELVEINSSALARRNQVLGSISLGTYRGIILDSRGNTATLQVQDTTIRDYVGINHTNQPGVRAYSTFNTQIFTSSVFDGTSTGSEARGFDAVKGPVSTGGGVNSFFCTNCLAVGNDTGGFRVTADYATWNWTGGTSFGNGTNYNPASHVNYNSPDTPATTDPGLGTCYLWAPDGSAAATNGWGATILHRYKDGVLTDVPLWNPTTGEFPHGAIIAGVNDVAGSSLFDVHERLNVNIGGCPFPASYAAATTPQFPPGTVTTEGGASPSHARTITAGIASATVFVMLKDDGGNVGTVTGVTGCAAEAYTFLGSMVTSPAYRRVDAYGKLTPTTGECTISATTSGNVSSSVLSSAEVPDISAYGDVVTCAGLSQQPSCTVPTTTGETILDGVAAKPLGGWTAGVNQTLQEDSFQEFPTPNGDIRGIVSTKSGTNGGQMIHTGPNAYWAQIVVAMEPTVPDPPATNELDVTKYGFFSGFGTEAGSRALSDTSTAVSIAPTGMVRVRTEITAEVATTPPFGFSLYCRKNADGYTQALDTFGSNVFRLYGTGVDPNIPSSLSVTTPRLTAPDGNSVAGAFIRDESSAFIAPAMATGKRMEMEWLLVLNAAVGDAIDCQPRFDSGIELTTYTVTPRINVITPSASGFASLPDQPWGLTATPNPFWGPRPSRGFLVRAGRSLW